MNDNLGDAETHEQVRRSGRCRTVNSIYAESIGEIKKSNRKSNVSKKPHHKTSFAENQQSDECQMRITLEKEPLGNYQRADIRCEDGTLKTVEVLIQTPQKPERRSSRMIKPPQEPKKVHPPPLVMIKRKTSAFKSSVKEIPKEEVPTSLLDIMLNAAMKIKEQPHNGEEQVSNKMQESMDNQEEHEVSLEVSEERENKRPAEFKQRIRGFQKDEANRKLAKIQMRFQNLKKRYQELRPKLMFSLFQS